MPVIIFGNNYFPDNCHWLEPAGKNIFVLTPLSSFTDCDTGLILKKKKLNSKGWWPVLVPCGATIPQLACVFGLDPESRSRVDSEWLPRRNLSANTSVGSVTGFAGVWRFRWTVPAEVSLATPGANGLLTVAPWNATWGNRVTSSLWPRWRNADFLSLLDCLMNNPEVASSHILVNYSLPSEFQ